MVAKSEEIKKEEIKKDDKPVKQESPKRKQKFKCCACGTWNSLEDIHVIMVRQVNTVIRNQDVKFICNADVEVCGRCIRGWRVG